MSTSRSPIVRRTARSRILPCSFVKIALAHGEPHRWAPPTVSIPELRGCRIRVAERVETRIVEPRFGRRLCPRRPMNVLGGAVVAPAWLARWWRRRGWHGALLLRNPRSRRTSTTGSPFVRKRAGSPPRLCSFVLMTCAWIARPEPAGAWPIQCVEAGNAPRARSSSAARRDSSNAVTARSTESSLACASQMNHGSRLSGSGIAPRACIPTAIAS